jgi:hypothetical protein
MSWALQPVTGVEQLPEFEERVAAVAGTATSVPCRYDRERFDPVTLELDYQASESPALALAEAIRLDGDVTVNMAPLAFIDVGSSCSARPKSPASAW